MTQTTMKATTRKRSIEEILNTLTHLTGVVFTLAMAWLIIRPGIEAGWSQALGVILFLTGMLIMFSSSSMYHWILPGDNKRRLRIFDHISIYIMIAASYTPICIGIVGGTLGWVVFGLMWAAAIAGAIYKITAIGKYPRLSLILYLVMGWSVVFIAMPVCDHLSATSLALILAEGLFYTTGTYFYAHDTKRFFHAIWHLFVLLGAVCHWMAIWIAI